MAPAAIEETEQATSQDPVGKPPSNVVLPPKDARVVVEKTAAFIARRGREFEDRIRKSNIDNPKFSFINPGDPYYAFYQWRLDENYAGRGTDATAGQTGETATSVAEKPKGPVQPPDFHFSARMPNISAQDFDVVKLTALFVAKNGRSFMTTLSQKEAGNFQFDFLRPQHSLYQFFSRLVDQYSEILNAKGTDGGKAEAQRIAELQQNIKDPYRILGRAKQRAEWVKHQEDQKRQKEEDQENEKIAYAQIDWHDFVVVETVLFDEADDHTELAPPTSLNDLQSASLEQKGMMSLQPSNMRLEEAMPDYDPYMQPASVQQTQHFPPQPSPVNFPPHLQHQQAAPSYSPVPPQSFQQFQPPLPLDNLRTETQTPTATRPNTNAPMNIRNDYVPRAQARRQQAAMAICPNCNQSIPYDEFEQHIRIEQLDPRWREERAKADSRLLTTNLSTADVANNLKRLASQRSDVFEGGLAPEQISEEESKRRKKAATSYDGVLEPNGGIPGVYDASTQAKMQQMQSMNIDEQIRHIHQKAKGDGM